MVRTSAESGLEPAEGALVVSGVRPRGGRARSGVAVAARGCVVAVLGRAGFRGRQTVATGGAREGSRKISGRPGQGAWGAWLYPPLPATLRTSDRRPRRGHRPLQGARGRIGWCVRARQP